MDNISIIAVDDDPVYLKMLETCLAAAGKDIRTAISAKDALSLIEERQPAIMIIDIMMPEMSGLELLEIVSEKYPLVYSIMLTAVSSEEKAIQALNHGAFAYLRKPCTNAEISIFIERAIVARYNMIALRESEERFKALFQNIPLGVAVYVVTDDGVNFKIVDMNTPGQRITKRSISDIIGKNIEEAFPGSVEMGMIDALRTVWMTGEPIHVERAHYFDDIIGERYYENWIYLLPSCEVVAIYRDITDYVIQQQALSKAVVMITEHINQYQQ